MFAILVVIHEETHIRNLVDGGKQGGEDFDKKNKGDTENGDELIQLLYFSAAPPGDFAEFTGMRFDVKDFEKKALQFGRDVIKRKKDQNESEDVPAFIERVKKAGVKITYQ